VDYLSLAYLAAVAAGLLTIGWRSCLRLVVGERMGFEVLTKERT
jgi:hypothetical protein